MKPRRSNKMPKDFSERVSEGLKLHHRKRKLLEAERSLIDAVMVQWTEDVLRHGLVPPVQAACSALEALSGKPTQEVFQS